MKLPYVHAILRITSDVKGTLVYQSWAMTALISNSQTESAYNWVWVCLLDTTLLVIFFCILIQFYEKK